MAPGGFPPSVEKLISHIRRLAEHGAAPILAALDGRCAAGKTTLANALSERFGWSVVHLDDFFPRPEQRTPERLAEPGGNLDRERVLAEALTPLQAGKGASYRPFDCKTQRFSAVRRIVPPAPVTLVEGAYACHPALWDRYSLRVFLDVDPAEQRRRILARDGPVRLEAFLSRWIPLEEAYFSAYAIRQRCDHRNEL